MIPLFGYLYNRGRQKEKLVSILDIFPYFVLGFIGMIVLRNIGDHIIQLQNYNNETWNMFISYTKI